MRAPRVHRVLGGARRRGHLGHGRSSAMPVVGFLRSTPLTDAENLVVAFRQGLKEKSFVDGQNTVVQYRYAEIIIIAIGCLLSWLI